MHAIFADEPALNFFGVTSDDCSSGFGASLDSQTLLALENAMTAWARMDGRHRLIVRRDGNVLAASKGAEGYLAANGSMRLHKGRLSAASRMREASLDRALRVPLGEVAVEVMTSRDPGLGCIIRATPFDEGLICLTLQPVQDEEEKIARPDLRAAFGLTRSEEAVVIAICSGHTPQDIADEHNISIHTVRAHLRHCYGKLGVNCREELWHRLQPYLAA